MSSDDETRSAGRQPRRSGSSPAARRVGPYRLDGELGRGGMGIVHRAFDERLHREVALKALPEELARDAEQLARLEREARSLAAVSHPNVASIFGMEEAEGVTYLVLELVPGETLHARLDGGALPPDEALALCAQVASGLEAVHRKGLVHRDLKPGNVMVTPEGTAKLLDFGLARRAREEARGEVTRRGAVLGTPGWMSPEQLRGEELDARSDAFAWGCLLYECLAGVPAFPGETWSDRDAAVLKDEPSWAKLPDLSPDIIDLIRECLSKDRSGRPATLAQGRRRLEEARLGSTGRLAAAAIPEHSLPAERDAFVGREAELAELARIFDDGTRLVSVLGLGGTGKTRLALHFAWQRLAHFPGGAWFADLSEARSIEGIVHAVATSLGVPLGEAEPVVQLGHAIAGRGRCLVVLDNFEQVAPHADATLGRWLDRAGEASFVVTTREVLDLAGERALALTPLAPEEAEILFLERARAARGDRAVDEDEREQVARLVALLDALPLAIELAAARMRAMSVEQVLARMDERFKLLSRAGVRRDRQATLRATLDWSWELLTEWEQAALARLSVFERGFTLEAAEAVLDLSLWSDAPWAVDVVQALVDKSLVRRAASDRLEMLVTVQEYAAQRLDTLSGRADAEHRHGRFFAALGSDEALDAMDRHGGVERRRDLTAELENLVAACRRAVVRGDGATAASTLTAASAVLEWVGPASVARALSAEVLTLASLTASERARALAVAAWSLARVGRPEDGAARFEQALEAARALGDRRSEGRLLGGLGFFYWEQGRLEEAQAVLEQALAIHREVGDPYPEARTLVSLGLQPAEQGRIAEARGLFEQALSILREMGNRRAEGATLANLAQLHQELGQSGEARDLYEQSLTLARELGNRYSEGIVLSNLGGLCMVQGRLEEAQGLMAQALEIHRHVGNRRFEGVTLGNLANLSSERGHAEEALALYGEALAILRESGNRRIEAEVLGDLAHERWRQDRPAETLASYEQALAVHRELGDRRNEGIVLGRMGELHASEGRLAEASAAFDAGEALLRELAAGDKLAVLMTAKGRSAAAAGDESTARQCLEEVATFAARFGADPASALSRELARLRQVLSDAGDPSALQGGPSAGPPGRGPRHDGLDLESDSK